MNDPFMKLFASILNGTLEKEVEQEANKITIEMTEVAPDLWERKKD